MKTITELQTELQEAAAQLETLSSELAELQETKTKQEVDFRHIEIVGQRYPMSTHHMKGQPQELQKHYFAVLSRLLLSECDNPRNGWLFVQRLLTTAGCSVSLTGLQADAGALTAEQLDQTTAELITKELQNGMLLDLMLLYLACEGREQAQDYITTVAELLGSRLQEVRELAKLAAYIAKKDAEKMKAWIAGCAFDLKFAKGHLAEVDA